MTTKTVFSAFEYEEFDNNPSFVGVFAPKNRGSETSRNGRRGARTNLIRRKNRGIVTVVIPPIFM